MSFRRPLTVSRSGGRSRSLAATVAAAGLALTVSACGTGQGWVEEGLNPSGNGVYTTVGSIQAQNLTLVQGPEGSSSLALVGNFLNEGKSPDALVGATVTPTGATAPAGAVITDGKVALEPNKLTNVGYNAASNVSFFNTKTDTSTYVPVTLTFKDAGTTTVNLLVVPASGIYEGIKPGPQPR